MNSCLWFFGHHEFVFVFLGGEKISDFFLGGDSPREA